jgi:molybdenum cofactor biosynthesis enzyme MoaA
MQAEEKETRAAFPAVPMQGLDTLWFQVSGTLCNLSCGHCFISCTPHNRSHEMMDLDSIRRYLAEADDLGVREIYFTGGEPFIHPGLLEVLELALRHAAVTVLTNGILIDGKRARALAALAAASRYSLDLRISLDGFDAAQNDAVRGPGTFARATEALRHLARAGFNPILTVTGACEGAGSDAGRARFLAFLGSLGLAKPRLKVMPLLRLGAEADRTRPYEEWESLRGETLGDADFEKLQCASARMVTAKGVYVCPILIDNPEARMGATVGETLRPYPLRHRACHTCHTQGLSCKT